MGVRVGALSWLQMDVTEAEEIGLWLHMTRDGMPRMLMLRWDYILAVDIPSKVEVIRMGLRQS